MKRYPGIRPFTTEDQHLFKGRDEENRDLFELIVLNNIVVLFGKSGIGKSSLLNAGVCPQLEDRNLHPVFIRLNNTALSPEEQVYQFLKEKSYISSNTSDGLTLWEYFKQFWYVDLGEVFSPVIVFDQFEELFTLYTPEQRQSFIDQLADMINGSVPSGLREKVNINATSSDRKVAWETPPKVKFVLSIRSDYLYLLDELSEDIPAILRTRFQLQPLNRSNAIEAMALPAALTGAYQAAPFTYSEAALEEVIEELGKKETGQLSNTLPNPEPEIEAFQLQLFCQQIEHKLITTKTPDGFTVTPDFYGGKKGITQIIGAFYAHVIERLPEEYRDKVETTMAKALIRNRRRIIMEETAIIDEYNIPLPILNQLHEERLLRKEARTGNFYYEISHDTLIAPILEKYSYLEAFEKQKKQEEERSAQKREMAEFRKKAEEDKQRLIKETELRDIAEEKSRIADRRTKIAVVVSLLALFSTLFALMMWNQVFEEKENAVTAEKAEKIATLNALNQTKIAEEAKLAIQSTNNELLTKQKELEISNAVLESTLKKLKSEKLLSDQRLRVIEAKGLEVEASILRNEILELKKKIEQLEIKNEKDDGKKLKEELDKKYYQAIQYCDSALIIAGHSHSAYRIMGDLHTDMLIYDKAVLSFRNAVHNLKDFSMKMDFLQKGVYASIEGDLYEDALFFYTELVAHPIKKKKVFYLTERANTYNTLGDLNTMDQRRFYQLAKQDISEAILLSPIEEQFSLYELRAKSNEKLGDINNALTDLTTAIEVSSTKAIRSLAYSRRAKFYKEVTSEFSLAISDLEAAFDLTLDKTQKKLIQKELISIQSNQAPNSFKKNELPKVLSKADSLYASGNYKDALQKYIQLIKYVDEKDEISKKIKTLEEKIKTDFSLPNDELMKHQWYLKNSGKVIDADFLLKKDADAKIIEAWEYMGSLGSSEIVIAVIDNGFDLTHPDLKDKVYKPFDLWNQSSKLDQDSRFTHGTPCAGIALASANGTGMIGVAPNAKFMPVSGTSFSLKATEQMFSYCTENGADIISCPWGSTDPAFDLSPLKKEAIAKAARNGRNGKGSVIIYAVGNDDLDYINFYAQHPDVIAVASSSSKDEHSSYSNRGKEISVCAPSNSDWPVIAPRAWWDEGVSWESGQYRFWRDGKNRGDKYKHFGGTPTSVAIVAGICALVLSENPDLTAKEVKKLLERTADKIGKPEEYINGHSNKYGYGRVNAFQAVKEARRMRNESLKNN